MPTRRRQQSEEIMELTQWWHRTLGSKHKHLPKDINATSLLVNLFHGGMGANGLCMGSRCNTVGGAVSTAGSPSYVTAMSLLCHMPLYTWSHLLTHVPKLSIWTGEKRKRPSACINQAAKLTCCITAGAPEVFLSPCVSQGEIKEIHICSATADTYHTHMPEERHWVSRAEVIWHQKTTKLPEGHRSYEAYLLSYPSQKKSSHEWVTSFPSRHPSPCVTCGEWQTSLLKLVVWSQSVPCISPAIH